MAGWPDTTGWLTCPQNVLPCHLLSNFDTFHHLMLLYPKWCISLLSIINYRSVLSYLLRDITLSGFQLMSQVQKMFMGELKHKPWTVQISWDFISYEVILGDIARVPTSNYWLPWDSCYHGPLDYSVSSLLFLALNCYFQNIIRSFIILSINNANQLFL